MKPLRLHMRIPLLALMTGLFASILQAQSPTGQTVQDRVNADIEAREPVVAHVVVALCDNANQGIVPVPKSLGDGQNPRTNLYWGAAYGVRTFFKRQSHFELLEATWDLGPNVLDSAVFRARVDRSGAKIDLFVVAEAWDGSEMAGALSHFLKLAAGHDPTDVKVSGVKGQIHAGGASAVVVFVGHNGLMEMPPPIQPAPRPGAKHRSSMVLACASRPFFLDLLHKGGSHPALLTTGLMAPEAYTLEAALTAFATGQQPSEIREAAAAAYHRYQQCGTNAALRLFSSEP